MPELLRSLVLTSGARMYGLAAGMLSLIVTARALGPDGRGQVAAAVTWAALISTLGYFSLGQVTLYSAGRERDSRWLARHVGALLSMTLAVTLLGWLVVGTAYVATAGRLFGDLSPGVLSLGMLVLPFLVWEHYGSALLMSVDRLGVYNRAQVVGRSVSVIAAVLLVLVLDAGVAGALVAVLIGQAVVSLTGLRLLVELCEGGPCLERATARDLLVGGAKLHLNAIGTFLLSGASILVVQFHRGPEETGYFQLATQLVAVLLVIPQAASTVLYGEVARTGADRAWRATRRLLTVVTVVMLALAAVAAVAAPVALPAVVGGEFRSAVPIFQVLLIALVGQGFATVLAPQWIGRGLFWQASAASLTTGALTLASCALLVPRYGALGAAWATAGVFLVAVVGNGAFAVWVDRQVASRSAEGPEPVAP